ncbi:hypothetical protein ZOSMA_461G00060 [Zostera marina]|uniref:ABC transporter domain-containing protein n=1 Tax=Zostera marina TaxID=29655 RepID=A0A0K9P0E5_ZOSMR|nr:hypothetical protein ZOSMA_461G00060 [Zostera marina]
MQVEERTFLLMEDVQTLVGGASGNIIQKATSVLEVLSEVLDSQHPELVLAEKDDFTLDLVQQCSFQKQQIMHIVMNSRQASPGTSQAIISREKLIQLQRKDMLENEEDHQRVIDKNLTLPFQPLTLSFEEIEYYVDAPKKNSNSNKGKLQLLHGITASCRPGVLTALMGVSAAGKTTLMDVLARRKTGGIIKGEIRIDGYPKEFVKDVLQIIELDRLKDAIVGIPGMSGLSRKQRKRLTIAV